MSDWSLWVLDHGLPPLLEVLEEDEVVPIERWAGPRFGAVLHVGRYRNEEGGEEELDSEVEVFRRTVDGWEPSTGGGGSNWFDPPFERSAGRTPLGRNRPGVRTSLTEMIRRQTRATEKSRFRTGR